MKMRLGVVSNSSSTSFTCEICGHEESGMDCSLADLGFVECINNHVICEDEMLNPEKCVDVYEIAEECCPICSNEALSIDELPYLMASLMDQPLELIKKKLLILSKKNGREWVEKSIKTGARKE